VSRSGIEFLLASEGDIEIIGFAERGTDVLPAIDALRPDVLILDLMLPGTTGLVVLDRLMQRAERPKVLIISGNVSGLQFKQAMDIGADGLLSKEDDSGALLDAIRTLRRGGQFVSSRVHNLLETGTSSDDAGRPLTSRERQVLALVAEGHSNEAIASELGISAGTAKKHRENIRAKLGISTAVEATRAAARLGLVKLT